MTDKIVKPSHGKVGFKSNAQMVTWPASNYPTVNNYFLKCQEYTKEIEAYTDVAIRNRKLYEKTRDDKYWILYQNADRVARDVINDLNRLIDVLENKTRQYKYSDKKNGFDLGLTRVEPQTIAIQENSLVNPALKIYAKQIANAGTEEFRYISSGTSALPTTPEMNRLVSENSRLDIFVNGGYRNPNGDVVREGVVFPPALDDALVKEFGSFTAPQANAGTMQWRNVIEDPEEQVEHDQGQTFYSIAHVTILEITFIE
jgi:hypothetical protein